MRTEKAKLNSKGSALIMAVAVVSLLAMVGAIFVLMSRMESYSTSSLADYKSLDNAVDSVVSAISMELKLDTPGVEPNTEYYDYPGTNDKWLANLEPYDDGGVYKWGQITDLFDDFNNINDVQDIVPTIVKDSDSAMQNNLADADGDGVADSKWVKLDNISSSSGKPLYAAIRVIDNGGMINVNTAYQFDPKAEKHENISGRYLRNVDFLALAERNAVSDANDLSSLEKARDVNNNNLWYYESKFQNTFSGNYAPYTPFDITDELRLRYRYILDYNIGTRIEDFWDSCYEEGLKTPVATNGDLTKWKIRSEYNTNEPNGESNYDYRHISTIYNMDRVIQPNGQKQYWANDPNFDAQLLYDELKQDNVFNDSALVQRKEFAQICANIKDYGDEDANVSLVTTGFANEDIYGWERPFINLSEIATNYIASTATDPNTGRSFAIELFKEFDRTKFSRTITEWEVVIDSKKDGIKDYDINDIDFNKTGGHFYVMVFEDPNAKFDPNDIRFLDSPADGAENVDIDVSLSWGDDEDEEPDDPNITYKYDIYFGDVGVPCSDCNDIDDKQPCKVIEDANESSSYHKTLDPNEQKNAFYKPQPALDPDKKYCWRVDTTIDYADPCKADITYKGDVQTFETADGDGHPDPEYFPVINLEKDDTIKLYRYVENGASIDEILVDTITIPDWFVGGDPNLNSKISFHRDIRNISRIKKVWNDDIIPTQTTKYDVDSRQQVSLGRWNRYNGLAEKQLPPIQALHQGFNTIGDIGGVIKKSIYEQINGNFTDKVLNTDTEKDVRINLADPNVQQIFKYITRIRGNGTETRIKGRININTAPWFVLAQLPWISKRDNDYKQYDLAKSIIAYRDKQGNYAGGRYNVIQDEQITERKYYRPPLLEYSYLYTVIDSAWQNDISETEGFRHIGELCNVIDTSGGDANSIYYYALDDKAQRGFPDLTFFWHRRSDGMTDDFEERNLIFARISDLVTVRSDVFTAYVLVRLGEDGPQRRAIAILDRSEVDSTGGKVKVLARYIVPDAR